MPYSNPTSIPTVLHFTESARPRRVLDIGVGVGAYGLLLRTHLDIAFERYRREQWQLKLDGLEIFPDYRNPVWDYAYDHIHLGDVRTMDFPRDTYDLVLINDVLEHLTDVEAVACLNRLLTWAPTVIATTPHSHIEQGAWGGNPHETHRSVLTPAHFPHLVAHKRTGMTDLYVCCRDETLAAKLRWDAATAPIARPELLPYIGYRLRRKWRSLTGRAGKP